MRLDLVASCVICDALRMIAGRGGDHTAGTFVGAESEKLIQGAPLFECTGALLVIELQENRIIGEAGKSLRVRAGRDANVRANSVKSGLNVRELDHDADTVTTLYLSWYRGRMVAITKRFVAPWKPKEQQVGLPAT